MESREWEKKGKENGFWLMQVCLFLKLDILFKNNPVKNYHTISLVYFVWGSLKIDLLSIS